MWPVGLIGKFGVSSPVVKNGTIIGFYDSWSGGRKFPVDMAGFAVNVQFLLSRKNFTMPYKAGFEEDGFLKSLQPLSLHEIEVLASNCTEVRSFLHYLQLLCAIKGREYFTDLNMAYTNKKILFSNSG